VIETTNLASQLNIQPGTLIAIVVINIFLFAALVAFIFFQNRKITRLEEAVRPKYGFLGKPLLSTLAIMLMVGGFGVTYFVSKNIPDYSVGDEYKVTLEIKTDEISRKDEIAKVKFQVVPTVNGYEWGANDINIFDVFWSVNGPKDFSEFESGLHLNFLGGFIKDLPIGTYEIRVDVVYEGFTWTTQRTLQL
jgi:hypothetical protein